MIEIIHDYQPEYNTTPNAGWKNGKFYLVSNGQGLKRVYSSTCPDLPSFAWEKSGSPKRKINPIDEVIKIYDDQPDGWKKLLVSAVGSLTPSDFDKLPMKVIGAYNRYK